MTDNSLLGGSLYWGDGLFLRPHHFQLNERLVDHKVACAHNWASPYSFGIESLTFDQEALANWQVRVGHCRLRLNDGTNVIIPEQCEPPTAAIPRELFDSPGARVQVFLGVAEFRRGSSNTESGDQTGASHARFITYVDKVGDENQSDNREDIEFRRLNVKVLVGAENTQGFDAIPILQLKLGTTAEAPPEIDPEFIPPVLNLAASDALNGMVRSVVDYLGANSAKLGRQMADRHVAFDSGRKEDFERILKLHAINSALGGLTPMSLNPRAYHPADAYRELCDAIGEVAIFQQARVFPSLPAYDHMRLGPIFSELKPLLEFGDSVRDTYITKPINAQGLQLTVRMEQQWLESNWSFYIGVRSPLPTPRVNELLTSERELGMKVGPAEEVDNLYRAGRRGVRFVPTSDVPVAFPKDQWHYFLVERDRAWEEVERTLNLGIRCNERRSQIQSQQANVIEVYDRETKVTNALAFTLYAIQSH